MTLEELERELAPIKMAMPFRRKLQQAGMGKNLWINLEPKEGSGQEATLFRTEPPVREVWSREMKTADPAAAPEAWLEYCILNYQGEHVGSFSVAEHREGFSVRS